MNDRDDLRQLVQKLGDAISDAITNSKAVADALKEISNTGYYLFLELDASVLARADAPSRRKRAANPKPLVKEGKVNPDAFSKKDKMLLKKMRIKFDDK